MGLQRALTTFWVMKANPSPAAHRAWQKGYAKGYFSGNNRAPAPYGPGRFREAWLRGRNDGCDARVAARASARVGR